MPQPTTSELHVDSALTNFSIGVIQAFQPAAMQIFPMAPVAKQSDKYYVYDAADWHRIVAENRAPGTLAAIGGFGISTDNYFADEVAIAKTIPDEDRENADAVFDVDRDAVDWVTLQQKLKMDSDWASAFFAASLWSADVTPGTLWSAANSTPIEDIRAQRNAVGTSTGYYPNVLAVGVDVDAALKDHETIIDRFKHTNSTGRVTDDFLKGVFEVDRYVVLKNVKVTSVEGAAAVTTDTVASKKDALLVYAAPRASIRAVTGGVMMAWRGPHGAANANAPTILRGRAGLKRADHIEGSWYYDMKLTAAELGVFFDNPVA